MNAVERVAEKAPAEDAAATSRSRRDVPDTHQKALAINLDPTSFGSFAEIGAGQEVARWFLRVGGASGTVAKTVSAYDKVVSDVLYGAGTRYVSKQRLEAMLESEWTGLMHQVGAARAKDTRLFAFADTIAARNFTGSNDCHGWIGVRFQVRPGAEPCDLLLHVNLRDSANVLQQEAVGILGVNLLHALLNDRAAASEMLAQLLDNITRGRIEIDQVDVRGSAFAGCDVWALHASLVRDGLAEAVTLDADGAAVAANEFLYKRAVVIIPPTYEAGEELPPPALAACVEQLRRDISANVGVKDVIGVRLLTVGHDSASAAPKAMPDAAMMTRHPELYSATSFIRRYSQAPLRFALTLPALVRIFDEARYENLEGRLLEGISRLFASDVRVLVCPCQSADLRRVLVTGVGEEWEFDENQPETDVRQLRPPPPLRHLYEFLLASGFLVGMP